MRLLNWLRRHRPKTPQEPSSVVNVAIPVDMTEEEISKAQQLLQRAHARVGIWMCSDPVVDRRVALGLAIELRERDFGVTYPKTRAVGTDG